MFKQLVCSAILVASTAVLAEESRVISLEAQQKMLKTSFDILDANDDGIIDENEARVDEALSDAYFSVARQGRITPKEYFDWRMQTGKKERAS